MIIVYRSFDIWFFHSVPEDIDTTHDADYYKDLKLVIAIGYFTNTGIDSETRFVQISNEITIPLCDKSKTKKRLKTSQI